ncbi:hypothetical protein [Pararhodonellum marinum]|uniref:hypothetical protein n=1 Tax=Pararhodonellum marinum TaxID=2755358 RepID=UPI00188E8B3D|nr:hypothetical protein [Pararhodonellum marinum]
MYMPFEKMSSQSRVWIYQADREFLSEEKAIIQDRLKAFCEQWGTHGSNLSTSFDIKFDQIIVLAVDESKLGASGCSIDSSVKVLRELEAALGVDLVNQGKVSYLSDSDKVSVNSISGIKSAIHDGLLKPETLVLNPIVNQKQDLDKKWIIPAKESWLNKYFDN